VSGRRRNDAAEATSNAGAHEDGQSAVGLADVYLHIGLKKTGTSYLQRVLWLSRERLAADGVLVPGRTRQSQTRAVWDLMGRRLRGRDQAGSVGSWHELVSAATGWSGSHVVISEETLSMLRPRQVRRAVRAFAPARVHVVVTARDLAEVICSTWQQQLGKGRTWSWDEYASAVRDPRSGPVTAGIAFWLGQDLLRVLDTWEKVVPHSRVHLVTVPPVEAAPSVLLERFAVATRLCPTAVISDQPAVNVAVGVAEAEVLRHLNLGLGGRLDEEQYIRVIHKVVRPALRNLGSSPRIQLPQEELGWVAQRATATVQELLSRGYQVTGDLADLVPPVRTSARSGHPDQVDDAELAQATSVALMAVTEQFAELRKRTRTQRRVAGKLNDLTPPGKTSPSSRRSDQVDEEESARVTSVALVTVTEQFAELWKQTRKQPGPVHAATAERLVSGVRARGYRAGTATLDIADHNRWVRWAVHKYLRRSSRANPTEL